jgi:hypothetical protein
MAALIAARLRGRDSNARDQAEQSMEDTKLSELPEEKDREFDLELGVLMLNG